MNIEEVPRGVLMAPTYLSILVSVHTNMGGHCVKIYKNIDDLFTLTLFKWLKIIIKAELIHVQGNI